MRIVVLTKVSCFSTNVSIKTTLGAFFSNTSIRRFSDSSNTARDDAAAGSGLPIPQFGDDDRIVETRAAAELNRVLRRCLDGNIPSSQESCEEGVED